MIPTEHKASIIGAGMHFMRSITEAYGPEEGLKLWEQITEVLDPDVKGDIFLAMITGQYTDRIRVSGYTSANKIATIKAFRSYDRRKLGLKEAKDLTDLIETGRIIELEVDPRNRSQIERELHSIGCKLA